MRAQTGTEMIILLSVSLFIVITSALLFTDLTGGVDTDIKYRTLETINKYPIGIKNYVLSQNCSYVELVNNQPTQIVVQNVMIDNSSFNTSLFPLVFDPDETRSALSCIHNYTVGDLYDVPIRINYSIMGRERIQSDDELHLKGEIISDEILTTAQINLLPVGISSVRFSESCTNFVVINNNNDIINVTNIIINDTDIQTNNLPVALEAGQSEPLLTCDFLPEVGEKIRYPILINYSISGISQSQNYSTYLEATSEPLSSLISPSENFYSGGIFGWWNFNNNTQDLGPHGFDATLVSSPQLVSGIEGEAYNFTVGPYVSLPDLRNRIDLLGGENGTITYSTWLYPNKLDGDWQHFANGFPGFLYFAIRSNGKVSLMVKNVVTGSNFWPISSGTLSAQNWYHIVFELNGELGYKMYINGELDRSVSEPQLGLRNMGGAQTGIGRSWSNSGGEAQRFFNGTIDQVIVWNKTLHPLEIKSLYLRGNNTLN